MSEAVMCDQGNLLTRGLGRRKSLEKGAMLLERMVESFCLSLRDERTMPMKREVGIRLKEMKHMEAVVAWRPGNHGELGLPAQVHCQISEPPARSLSNYLGRYMELSMATVVHWHKNLDSLGELCRINLSPSCSTD